MAAVTTSSERVLNKAAIVAVLIITLIFLAPIYWITSTAFKPRNLSTTIPPTIVFQPDVSPFVKLFTKRSQLRAPATEPLQVEIPGVAQRRQEPAGRRQRQHVAVAHVAAVPQHVLGLTRAVLGQGHARPQGLAPGGADPEPVAEEEEAAEQIVVGDAVRVGHADAPLHDDVLQRKHEHGEAPRGEAAGDLAEALRVIAEPPVRGEGRWC